MFEVPDLDIEHVLEVIAIEKIRFDHTGTICHLPLDEGYTYESFYESLQVCAEELTNGFIEEKDAEVFRFIFPYMRLFYGLCREYGRINGITFRKNPHILRALEFVNGEMRGISSYDYDWLLCAPKKDTHKKHCAFILFLGPEFYEFVELVETLFNIRDYYRQAAAGLLTELYGKKIKSIPPIMREAERRAA